MEFGKLDSIDAVDFTLPPSPPQTATMLQRFAHSQQKVSIYVGCPEWGNRGWIGTLYPAQTQAKDFLSHYAQQFNCIELNSTHYSPPAIETLDKWEQNTPTDFHFCPKVPQSISHHTLFEQEGLNASQQFQTMLNQLNQKLGISFLQLPPTLSAHQIHPVLHYLQHTPIKPLAVEFRHSSWFENGYFEHIAAWLEYLGITAVLTDVAGRRDVLHQRLTTPIAFIRFVGNRLHETDYQRLNAWLEQLVIWVQQGLQKIYFFVHQPEHNLLAPELAVYLTQRLNQLFDAQLHVPTFQAKPVQNDLF
ncbi:DUF72 domain-containing protein [Candidatus Albibeggiatoa sp. nov. NOAA]|uniref:DUF72 domain-containing protein n=1 Tax=Candidatus Albibeggiatoa sp. nov. NOAA TaxID=3162724 RepID=UPI003301828A|nr:DUF72 domain-containing protein [Thiotrichaceae bacterium]